MQETDGGQDRGTGWFSAIGGWGGWSIQALIAIRAPMHDPLPWSPTDFILNRMVQYSPALDSAFAAIADPTRRGILERLGRSDAAISELAEQFEMTLTGMKKHVRVLEDAKLVTTEKVGRVRTCRLGPRRLDQEAAWIAAHRRMLEARLNRLEDFLERTRGKQ